ncbi:BLUF domain-containing protein [Actinomycetospora sp. CA-101289]|uniref:BLUF domain-containing protein n=1 Tax=Actinomycetospora sp. CA-101289 TaxID=3239893 RepID=UPI003D965819
MADDSSAGGGPVFRLVYRSRLDIPADDVEAEVATILAAARRKNPQLGITGALVVWEDGVVQTLEGEEGVVRGVYDTISRDPRHEQVELVETTPGVERAFTRWSIAHISDGADADLPLSKQWEGGIDVSRPRLTTPEEDAVVSAMRDRVRGAPA